MRGGKTACPYCGSPSRFRFTARDWNQRSCTRAFAYRRCSGCGLVFIDPLPSDTKPFYVGPQYDLPSSLSGFEARVRSQAWKVELIAPHVAPGELLEVGPATGEFATAAREAGFRPTLIELDQACSAFLRDSLGHTVIESGDPAGALAGLGTFDAVCVWQTIEHIPLFWRFLAEASRHLRPGGILAVSTPNPVSFQARLLGRTWPHADAPRHLYLVPPDWFVREAARKWNLEPRVVTTRDVGNVGLNYYGWYLWVRNRFGRFMTEPRLHAWAARLTHFFSRWELREGQGCYYLVILAKKQ